MSSRFQNFINSYIITRDKLIKNKRIYSEFKAKNKNNYNKIIVRKMSTNNSRPHISFNKYSGNGNGNGPKIPFWYISAVAFSCYLSSKFTYKKI